MNKSKISPFPVRLEPNLRYELEESAKENNRSLQAEIVDLLTIAVGGVSEDEKRMRQIARQVALDVVQIELDRRLGQQT